MQVEDIAIGGQLGFLVPQEILDQYNVGAGGELLLKEIPGGFFLTKKRNVETSEVGTESSKP